MRPDVVSLCERLAEHFDEPFAIRPPFRRILVSEMAARNVKVVLTGDGGDELFAGYESFFGADRLRWMDRMPLWLRGMAGNLADALPYSAYGKNYLRMVSRKTALARYFEQIVMPYYLQRKLLASEWILPQGDEVWNQSFSRPLRDGPKDDVLAEALCFEATTKLTGDMLVKVDRMSMANRWRCAVLCWIMNSRNWPCASLTHGSWKRREARTS